MLGGLVPGEVAATPSRWDRVVSTGGYPLGNAIDTADRRNGTPEARNSHKSRYICVTTAHQASGPGELQMSTSSYSCHHTPAMCPVWKGQQDPLPAPWALKICRTENEKKAFGLI